MVKDMEVKDKMSRKYISKTRKEIIVEEKTPTQVRRLYDKPQDTYKYFICHGCKSSFTSFRGLRRHQVRFCYRDLFQEQL